MERQTETPEWTLPPWTKLITGGIDVQENCLYWTIRAWGDYMTSQNVGPRAGAFNGRGGKGHERGVFPAELVTRPWSTWP
ncbi:MAG: terminase gpA endonuclease subunit [Faecalibacterium prausnitzii]